MKIALIQDWLTSYGGGEKCLEAVCQMWPQADIFTIVYRPEVFANSIISRHKITTSFIDRLPFVKTKFRHYFPMYSFAIEQFDLRPYDLVMSFSSAFAHGVLSDPHQVHICYKHTPMRYAWSGYQEYLFDPSIRTRLIRRLTRVLLHRLRIWDYVAAHRVDHFIANSHEVRRRIAKYYRRDSEVIYPPVEVSKYTPPDDQKKDDFYLSLSRLVPYKKTDLIVRAFMNMPDKKLIVGGDGPELKRLKDLASAARNIEFIGFVTEKPKIDLMRRAKGFIFAAHEDFGIVPIEAQAAGTPVIAYGAGGVLETVIPEQTGIFFHHQQVQDIVQAVKQFEQTTFSRQTLLDQASNFSIEHFQKAISDLVDEKMNLPREPKTFLTDPSKLPDDIRDNEITV